MYRVIVYHYFSCDSSELQVSDEEPMLDEGEKTPEPLQQMPTSPPPSITTHSYTATSCVFPAGSSSTINKRKSGRNEDITRLSIGNKPEFYTDITVSPPTPGMSLYIFTTMCMHVYCTCVCVCVCVWVWVWVCKNTRLITSYIYWVT